MNMREAERLCERLTYKPGFRVDINRALHDDPHLGPQPVYIFVRASVPDVNDHARLSPIYNSEGHPWAWFEQATEEQIVSMIRNQFRRLEMHELDEWLRLDGVCVKATPRPQPSWLQAMLICPDCHEPITEIVFMEIGRCAEHGLVRWQHDTRAGVITESMLRRASGLFDDEED